MNGIEAVPRRLEAEHPCIVCGRQIDKAVVDARGSLQHVDHRKPTRWHEQRSEQEELRSRETLQAFKREICNDYIISEAAEPTNRIVHPGQGLIDGKAIEDVVADIGNETPSGRRRPILQLAPKAAIEDAGQRTSQEPASRAVRSTMAKRRQDFDVGSPRLPSSRHDGLDAAGQVAGAERHDPRNLNRSADGYSSFSRSRTTFMSSHTSFFAPGFRSR